MTATEQIPAGAALARHPFFSDLAEDRLARLAACATERSFAAGDIVFHEGGDANGFFVIRRGMVTVESKRPSGAPAVLQTLHDGEVLGWSWLTPPHRWAFDARAATPVEALFLDAGALRACFDADPALGHHVVLRFAGVMGDRLRAAHMRMMELEAD